MLETTFGAFSSAMSMIRAAPTFGPLAAVLSSFSALENSSISAR
jgi:hypothetical protein